MNLKEHIRKALNEVLTLVDDDVELLYDMFFKKDIEEIRETGIVRDDMFKRKVGDTSILQTKDAIKANGINPCAILVNYGYNGYQPSNSYIRISVNDNAKNFVLDYYDGNIEIATQKLPKEHQRINLPREFTPEKIKGSIHHELAHWIDDTFNRGHILKRLNKQVELGTRNLKNIPVNMTKMEIQGQIHNVKQLYNKYKEIWDDLSFMDMVKMSPPLNAIYNELNFEQKKIWIRDLKTRMFRENLLGRKMIN
jgi:hypothetical protein